MSEVQKIRWTALALGVLVCVAIAIEIWFRAPHAPPMTPIVIGIADVGGPFELVDQDGRPFTERDLVGRPHVLYFGWTRDPDLTPAALQVLNAAIARLQPSYETPRRVFISIDPERDKPEQMREFARLYGETSVALTGTSEQIAAITRAYKLYFKRLPDPALPEGYSIDHASLYYVLGRDGAFKGAIPHTSDVAELADALRQLLK